MRPMPPTIMTPPHADGLMRAFQVLTTAIAFVFSATILPPQQGQPGMWMFRIRPRLIS